MYDRATVQSFIFLSKYSCNDFFEFLIVHNEPLCSSPLLTGRRGGHHTIVFEESEGCYCGILTAVESQFGTNSSKLFDMYSIFILVPLCVMQDKCPLGFHSCREESIGIKAL